jgi:hypothetical protein
MLVRLPHLAANKSSMYPPRLTPKDKLEEPRPKENIEFSDR